MVLVFGNFTCGPFRGLYPDVDAVYRRYKDQATFVMVYVREAHPTDGWKMDSNAGSGVAVKQPTTYAERVEVCEQFRKKLQARACRSRWTTSPTRRAPRTAGCRPGST